MLYSINRKYYLTSVEKFIKILDRFNSLRLDKMDIIVFGDF